MSLKAYRRNSASPTEKNRTKNSDEHAQNTTIMVTELLPAMPESLDVQRRMDLAAAIAHLLAAAAGLGVAALDRR